MVMWFQSSAKQSIVVEKTTPSEETAITIIIFVIIIFVPWGVKIPKSLSVVWMIRVVNSNTVL